MTATRTRFTRRRWAGRLARLRWLWLTLVLAAVAAGAAWALLASSLVAVRSVPVSGNEVLTDAEIRAVAAVPRGRPLLRVDLAAVDRRVEAVPRVESARVTRAWPRGIAIAIRERTPIAVVADGASLRVLDRHGVLFGEVGTVPKRLPRITLTAASQRRADALTEVAAVVASLDPAIAHKVRTVEVASMDAIGFMMRNGDRVRWGSADGSPRKAEVLRSLLRLPASTYDVTAPDRPTTRS